MEGYRGRYRLFIGIIGVVLAILLVRLLALQIINHDEYAETARGNAIRPVRELPARGVFYDRNGVLLVDNVPTYAITILPRHFDRRKIGLLARLVGVSDSVVVARLREASAWSIDRPSRIFPDLPYQVFARVQERVSDLPGVGFEIGQKRRYVTKANASHAFGYVREISAKELERMRKLGYRMGDEIGKTGLERRYELYLRGVTGSAYKLVNSRGLAFASYQDGRKDVAPEGGYDLHLTLDAGLQALAESLFVHKRGGAVALDVNTGGILAIASAPGYDAAALSDPKTASAAWNRVLHDPRKPMLSRATMAQMPPGSTWKPFMALMALQEGLVKPNETYTCRGGHPLGHGRYFTCMEVHGAINVVEAIQHSCNTFFFEMMRRSNIGMFHKYATMFGFGRRAPTDLEEQVTGLIPDSAYFRRLTGTNDWQVGWEMSLGIGQGNMAVTPLQMARYVMTIANEGTLYAPHMVDYLEQRGTGKIVRPALPAPKHLPIDKENFDLVREGMRRVMTGGTGYYVQIPGIETGGKTGTAQNPHGKDDSIFIMFAPFDHPKIAVAVMVENAGFGAS
ncbi:MAG TPA: penicillin-binding protein 2, partial [Rhodothermales bacterium]|nr:penicillin-binding protein 2 [Rhodothermales bacterium]